MLTTSCTTFRSISTSTTSPTMSSLAPLTAMTLLPSASGVTRCPSPPPPPPRPFNRFICGIIVFVLVRYLACAASSVVTAQSFRIRIAWSRVALYISSLANPHKFCYVLSMLHD